MLKSRIKKISPIDCCFHCPLRKYRDGWGNYCEHIKLDHREIYSIYIIPAWCPLPDENEKR
jgi:hypothetical protein